MLLKLVDIELQQPHIPIRLLTQWSDRGASDGRRSSERFKLLREMGSQRGIDKFSNYFENETHTVF